MSTKKHAQPGTSSKRCDDQVEASASAAAAEGSLDEHAESAGGDHSLQRLDDTEFELKRRLASRWPARRNDVFISRRTDAAAQIARCTKLLDRGHPELYIHGLGAAVNRAVNIALQLKRRGLGSIDLDVNTSTLKVTDDLIPLLDDARPGQIQRNISVVHIRVFRPVVPVTDY